MPRPQFDRDTALDKSVDLFWQHGFHAASMQQVFAATGLKPGSIYLAFGSKEGLFKASIEHYTKASLTRTRTHLEQASSIGNGLCELLERLIKESQECDYCSCLLVKSQLELHQEYSELNELITQSLQKTEDQYAEFIAKEFEPNLAKIYANSLMLHIFGIRVYGYQLKDTSRIQQSLHTGLSWLPWKDSFN